MGLLDAPAASAEDGVVDAEVVLFWGDGCPYSAAAHDWLARFAAANPDLDITTVEVWDDDEGRAAFVATMAALDREPRTVPTLVVDGQVRVGFDERVVAWVEATAGGEGPAPGGEGSSPLEPDEGERTVDLGAEPGEEESGAGGVGAALAAGAAVALLAVAVAARRRHRRR